MEIEFKLDKNQIDKIIQESLVSSELVQAIQKSIQDNIKHAFDRYDSPVKNLVSQHINLLIKKILEGEHKETWRKLIAEKFTDEVIKKVMTRAIEKAVEELKVKDHEYD